MKLKVLGSGSSGNCYLLENKDECIILEAGLRYKDVQKALNYDVKKITGCLITHEHGDHAKYINEFLTDSIDVYASAGTWDAVCAAGHRKHVIEAYKKYMIGGFRVIPFPAEHDAAEPLGFLLRHADMGTLLFATDTYYLKDRFAGLNHILIECNYAMDILDDNIANGRVDISLRDRVVRSHMELNTCRDFLRENDLSRVNNIVLIHLSRQNGNGRLFKEEIMSLTGIHTCVAYGGMEEEINKDLF